MLGMFAMCQIIRDNAKGEAKMPDVDVKGMKGLGVGFKDIKENIKTILFSLCIFEKNSVFLCSLDFVGRIFYNKTIKTKGILRWKTSMP